VVVDEGDQPGTGRRSADRPGRHIQSCAASTAPTAGSSRGPMVRGPNRRSRGLAGPRGWEGLTTAGVTGGRVGRASGETDTPGGARPQHAVVEHQIDPRQIAIPVELRLIDLSIDEVIGQFDVTREQVMAVLDFVAESLRARPRPDRCSSSLTTARRRDWRVRCRGTPSTRQAKGERGPASDGPACSADEPIRSQRRTFRSAWSRAPTERLRQDLARSAAARHCWCWLGPRSARA
jgi:hypothetical protein